MNRIAKTTLILLMLAGTMAPVSLVEAKTVEDVPTADSTILSRTADPVSVSQRRLELEESEDSEKETEESTKDSKEESETTESSKEEKESSSESTKATKESSTESSEKTTKNSNEDKKQRELRLGIPRGDNEKLIEGEFGIDNPNTYDIDKTLSLALRKGYIGHLANSSFTGLYKNAGQLTFGDMKTLTMMALVGNGDGINGFETRDLKGLEFAINMDSLKLSEYIKTDFLINGEINHFQTMTKLRYLEVRDMDFMKIDFSYNNLLYDLKIFNNKKLKDLVFGNVPNLDTVRIDDNVIETIDISQAPKLRVLNINRNLIDKLDTSNNPILQQLDVSSNKLKEIDVSKNTELTRFYASNNQLSNITSCYGLPKLSEIGWSQQNLSVPVRVVDGKTTIDLLKTTGQTGLSATKGTISGNPIFSYDGDKIEISNITGADIDRSYLDFNYDPASLLEGITSYRTFFGGKIYLYAISDLTTKLKVDKKKIEDGKKASWTWTVTGLTDATASEVYPKLTLPSGLSLVSGSVKVDGGSVGDNAINGSTSLGNLGEDEVKTITFETTATGNAEEWLEAKGEIDWDDSTGYGPYNKESSDAVQIKDEEQTYTPQPTEEMGLLSVPIRFDYGIKNMASTDQSFNLSPDLYQTNTNVVSNGFYTRVKDDRSIGNSTGWSLTAQLSNFVDVDDPSSGMPDSYGTALELDGMSIEAIKDRDTAQEAIDPSPSSAAPGVVKTKETIVVGESAKTLVSAQPSTGMGTWQLRIPFDKVSLKLPANAGKEHSNYQAKLTWSLADTP